MSDLVSNPEKARRVPRRRVLTVIPNKQNTKNLDSGEVSYPNPNFLELISRENFKSKNSFRNISISPDEQELEQEMKTVSNRIRRSTQIQFISLGVQKKPLKFGIYTNQFGTEKARKFCLLDEIMKSPISSKLKTKNKSKTYKKLPQNLRNQKKLPTRKILPKIKANKLN